MAFMDYLEFTHISVFVGLGVTFIACILNIVTLGSVGWGSVPTGRYGEAAEFGLFRACRTTRAITLCAAYGQGAAGWIQAAAATRTIGTLLTIAGIIVIASFVLGYHRNKRGVYRAGFACLVAAVISSIVGVAIFTGFWEWAFYGVMFELAWAGTGILLVGVVILGVAMQYLAETVPDSL